jgi:hypothetical protein
MDQKDGKITNPKHTFQQNNQNISNYFTQKTSQLLSDLFKLVKLSKLKLVDYEIIKLLDKRI